MKSNLEKAMKKVRKQLKRHDIDEQAKDKLREELTELKILFEKWKKSKK